MKLTFIQHIFVKLIKSGSEDIYYVTKFYFKCCFFSFPSIKKILKNVFTVTTKILRSTTVFNIDNNEKCFLSTKSAY